MLLYDLKQAPHAEKLILQAYRLRKPVPESLIGPRIYPWCELYYRAFHDLVADRPSPDSPISWMAKQAWATHHGLDDTATELLHHHLQALDIEFLKWRSEKAKSNHPKAPPGEDKRGTKVAERRRPR